MLEKTKMPAIARMMSILSHLEKNGASTPASLIADLGLPKSTLYVLLEEMCHFNLIGRDDKGRYRLWMRLIELGHNASTQYAIRDVGRPFLERLARDANLLCHLGILGGEKAFYILKVESPGSISVRSREGKELSLNRSSMGKCLLAWQQDGHIEYLVNAQDYTPVTRRTITDKNELLAQLSIIRERGWALDDEEDVENIRCVAAPVFGVNNEICGAISAVGASFQIPDERIVDLAEMVKACARDLSLRLGATL